MDGMRRKREVESNINIQESNKSNENSPLLIIMRMRKTNKCNLTNRPFTRTHARVHAHSFVQLFFICNVCFSFLRACVTLSVFFFLKHKDRISTTVSIATHMFSSVSKHEKMLLSGNYSTIGTTNNCKRGRK